jgi:hypothetical protein
LQSIADYGFEVIDSLRIRSSVPVARGLFRIPARGILEEKEVTKIWTKEG